MPPTIKQCADCCWALLAGKVCGHPHAIRTEYKFTGRFGARRALHRHLTTAELRANGAECGTSGSLWRAHPVRTDP